MENLEQLIRSAVRAAEEINEIPFPVLIKVTTGHNVIPLDIWNSIEDRILFEAITKAATDFTKLCERTRRRFQGDRINEVGRAIEEEFVQELRKTQLHPELLGRAGYPDMKIIDQHGRVTYLESKAVSKDWGSGLRAFYYTRGDKIDSDARHLLIGWNVIEERDKYWRIVGWKLSDLSRLKVKLKAEFNASYKDLYEEDLVISSYHLK
jgi:hypothetical protein